MIGAVPDPTTERAFLSSPDWLGPRWLSTRGAPPGGSQNMLTVLDLIDNRTLPIDVASVLWELLARRASVVVVAGPSGVGKTTLLTALFDLIPASERIIPVRGAHDPLRYLSTVTEEARRSTLCINEISPHLPIYLWGAGVGRVLRSVATGFRLLATAHARSTQELVGQLAGYPLRISPGEIAALGVVVCLDAWHDAHGVRRVVSEITGMAPTERGGVELYPFLTSADPSIDLDSVAAWLAGRGQELDPSALETRHKTLNNAVSVPASKREEERLDCCLDEAYWASSGAT